MRSSLAAAFILLLATNALADAPKVYTSAALGFSASFPLEVREQAEADGSGTAAAMDPAGVMYMVGAIPSSAETQKMSVKEQLDAGIGGAVAKVKGTLASQKDIKLGKIPGREAEIDLAGAHATFRFYIAGTKAYMIGVVRKEGVEPPMAPTAFFASFKLLPAKKK